MADTLNEHMPQISIDQFQGPLDLLLFLIKKDEISIYDIPIHTITKQYIDYLESINEVDIEHMSEFFSMATTLLYIKSKMLLPVFNDDGEVIEDPRRDLVEKLIEYQKFKKLSEMLIEAEAKSEGILERRFREFVFESEVKEEKTQEARILLEFFGKIMKSLSHDKIISLFEEVSVNEKIALIHEYLDSKIEFSLLELITRPQSLLDLVCSFLAVLECTKIRLIVITQEVLYGDIRIKRRITTNE